MELGGFHRESSLVLTLESIADPTGRDGLHQGLDLTAKDCPGL